jgi:organic hydroperoxide reductase OsmC/OhrA
MHEYTAQLVWQRGDQAFTDNRYSRRHQIRFDGGAELLASSSPNVLRVPLSDPAGADPEELFVASLSSCHMLWFLSIAAQGRFCVDSYTDNAIGVMSKNSEGKVAMTTVTLRPEVRFSGAKLPSTEEIAQMHHRAHEECFIANSVRTNVRCQPIFTSRESAA